MKINSKFSGEQIISNRFPSLPNIEYLIEDHGEISIGGIGPIHCTATASDNDQCFAMLVRRNGETLEQLLTRLDQAIQKAVEDEIYIDEINSGPGERS